ncbi:AlpA family transcriptional regulator [Cronobacter dublinensis]|uniref:helix-turn-helix transcriptional regulator n=1 Tax=Cronobacter turicensis TaxID=413502 RepID=UPI0011AD850C|nr:AlpA family transcriptional regulator [Cronobacter turicensis]EKK4079439.1 AlpA family transcriptional regulator [Cronobacter dublinensis]ELU8454245.1 AlpA family transcriptional regulator [Cronobacter turicensis]ELY2796657.1 AlpA family transcriptional regulator [Cronobacter dublinensis]ELY3973252.1 AlpA family transcriptional regulator [Cronobacter dublinensis]ELY4483452.1 AlpA family transcriptional regulator [Cronobacter dublinensis]
MVNTEMISEKEVMEKLKVSSRMTIWTYTHKLGFPKPVRSRPKLYLLAEVEQWILNGGVNQKSA